MNSETVKMPNQLNIIVFGFDSRIQGFKDGYTGARLEPKIPGSSASRLSKVRSVSEMHT